MCILKIHYVFGRHILLDFCVTRHNLLYDNLNNGIFDIGKASILQGKKNQIFTIKKCPGSQAHPRAPKTVDSHDVWVMVTQNPKRMTQFMGATGQTCCPGIYLTRISGPHRPLFLEDGGWLLVITPFFVGFASLSLTNNLNLNIHLFETNTFLCVETNMHFCGENTHLCVEMNINLLETNIHQCMETSIHPLETNIHQCVEANIHRCVETNIHRLLLLYLFQALSI